MSLAAHILEVTPGQISSAKRHREKSVEFAELRKMRLLPETRQALTKAAQRSCPCCLDADCGKRASKLSAACHDVYAVIRTAIARGYAGAVISGNELARLLALSPRAAWYAIRRLRALKLITRVKQYERRAYTNVKTGKLYGNIKTKSSYLTHPSAPSIRTLKPRTPTAVVAVPPLLQEVHIQPSLRSGGGEDSATRCSSSPPSAPNSTPARCSYDEFKAGVLDGQLAIENGLASAAPSLEGAANRRTIAPLGAQDSTSAAERAAWLADVPAELFETERERSGRALRAAKKNAGAV